MAVRKYVEGTTVVCPNGSIQAGFNTTNDSEHTRVSRQRRGDSKPLEESTVHKLC